MASIANCFDTRTETNKNISAEHFVVRSRMTDAIHKVIGTRTEAKKNLSTTDNVISIMRGFLKKYFEPRNKISSYEVYGLLENTLTNLMMDNYNRLGSEFSPEYYMETVRDYIQKSIGYGYDKAMMRNKRTFAMMTKRLIADISEQIETQEKEGFNKFETILLPPDISSRHSDRYGYISNLVKKGRRLIEAKRTATAEWKERSAIATSKFIAAIETKLPKFIKPDYVMDGVPMRIPTTSTFRSIYEKVLRIPENERGNDHQVTDVEVSFMGSERRDGTTYHNFEYNLVDAIAGETRDEALARIKADYGFGAKELAVHGNSYYVKFQLDESEIGYDLLQKAVGSKYANELVNKLGAGQTRYVSWQNMKDQAGNSATNDANTKKIIDILLRNKVKSDNNYSSSEIHEIKKGNNIYYYVMLKNEEGNSEGESYNAYIVSRSNLDKDKNSYVFYYDTKYKHFSNKDYKKNPIPSDGVFGDAFYTSDIQKEFGKHVVWDKFNKEYVLAQSVEKEFGDFYRMENQPHPDLIFNKPYDVGQIQHYNLWQNLAEQRRIFSEIAEDVKSRTIKQSKLINKYLGKESKLGKLLGIKIDEEDASSLTKELLRIININSRVTVSKAGDIYTPDSKFQVRKENYWPHIYDDITFYKQIDTAIADLTSELDNIEDFETREKLIEQREQLLKVKKLKIGYEDVDEQVKATLAERTAHLKHRKNWTDATERRMDELVLNDYLDKSYNTIINNDYITSLLDTVYKITLAGAEDNIVQTKYAIDQAVDRVKINLRDPSMKIMGAEGFNPEEVAKAFNKVGIFGKNWKPEDVLDLVNNTKGIITGGMLRSISALVNRSQVTNIWITHGLKAMRKVHSSLENDPKIQAALDYIGVEQLTSAFEAFLSGGGGKITMKDAGSIMLPGEVMLPVPTRTFIDFVKMSFMNRDSAIKKGMKDIDKLLESTEMQRIQRIKNNQMRLKEKESYILSQVKDKKRRNYLKKRIDILKREQQRLDSEPSKRKIEDLRENFIDWFMTPAEDRNNDIMAAKIKKIHGEINTERLNRMTEWSVGYFPSALGSGFAKLFTMTEGEKEMRKFAGAAALIDAYESGMLKDDGTTKTVERKDENGIIQKVEVPTVLLSDQAINIVREAVSNTMFNMNIPNLGTGFAGLGGALGVLKSYSIQQMVHDYEITKSFFKSGSKTDALLIPRLAKAARDLYYLQHVRGKTYSGREDNLDHEAVRMLRLLSFRTFATVSMSLLRSLGMFRLVSNFIPLSRTSLAMIRGAESPLLGFPMRIATKALLLSFSDEPLDFDEDKEFIGIIEDIAKLFLPFLISYPLILAKDISNEWF